MRKSSTMPRPSVRKPGAAGHGPYETRPSRVSWQPLSDLIDWSSRSVNHSRRPASEQVPTIKAIDIAAAVQNDGAILKLQAHYSGLEVLVAVKGKAAADGYRAQLAWEVEPDIGSPEVRKQIVELAADHLPLGRTYVAHCPHCSCRRRSLFWAVETFACRQCLGLQHEALRLGRTFTLEKRAGEIRRKLGQPGGLLKPIILAGKGGISSKRRKLAERLWQIEGELLARVAE